MRGLVSCRRFAVVIAVGALVSGVTAMPAIAQSAVSPPPAHQAVSSNPPDRAIFPGPAHRARVRPALTPSGIFLTDATAAANSTGGNEPAIAVNPANPNQIVITRFNNSWNGNADLLYSTDGGTTWAEETSIPPPPGVTGTSGCPCDQTIDYGRNGALYGTFLTASSVVTGSTTDPTSATSWKWNGNPAQLTTGTRTNVDQPWLLVNRDPGTASQDDVYVAYDDFGGSPDARVAASFGATPVNITKDNKAGTESPLTTNPGLRLAADPRNGTMYALYEQSSGSSEPKSVTYKLNRSTDGGTTWTLDGSTDGLTVDSVNSDQAPGFKFGGVNALLGGVDHAAVDPANGDVYVVYGQDASGGNQIKIRRLTPDGSGGLSVGPASNVSTSTNAALPSVAVTSDGTVGVLYDTFDGTTASGFPIFSVHFARSTDHGATFSDVVLQTFQSPQTNITSNGRQRVLGDFQQLKAVGGTFYGTFAGNTSGVPATSPPIDAMFFAVPKSAAMTLTSSANPSAFGQPVSFTAQVSPVPDGGTITFTADGSPLDGPVPVDTTTGRATSASITTLTPGTHTVVATYGGTANFAGATATLIQAVTKAPVTTALTSPGPSFFGHTVTVTDTVCPAPPSTSPSVPPSGTMTFTDGGFSLGTASLSPGGGAHCSQAHLSWSNLLPGSHTITAAYGGDANYLASGTETLSQPVRCRVTVTGKIRKPVHAEGESFCVINATVHGPIVSHEGTALFVGNSAISGNIIALRGTLVAVCGSALGRHGSVIVSFATRFVVVGDPGDDHCAANRVAGHVLLMHNSGGTELRANQIRGNVHATGDTGTGPFSEDTTTEIERNTIGGSLNCNGNIPPPTNDGQPNSTARHRTGQCAAL